MAVWSWKLFAREPLPVSHKSPLLHLLHRTLLFGSNFDLGFNLKGNSLSPCQDDWQETDRISHPWKSCSQSCLPIKENLQGDLHTFECSQKQGSDLIVRTLLANLEDHLRTPTFHRLSPDPSSEPIFLLVTLTRTSLNWCSTNFQVKFVLTFYSGIKPSSLHPLTVPAQDTQF